MPLTPVEVRHLELRRRFFGYRRSHVELESLLRSTLVSAERAAQDMREQARRESDLVVQEASAEGRRLLRDAIAEKERLLAETRQIRTSLQAALAYVGDEPSETEGETPDRRGASPAPGLERLAG